MSVPATGVSPYPDQQLYPVGQPGVPSMVPPPQAQAADAFYPSAGAPAPNGNTSGGNTIDPGTLINQVTGNPAGGGGISSGNMVQAPDGSIYEQHHGGLFGWLTGSTGIKATAAVVVSAVAGLLLWKFHANVFEKLKVLKDWAMRTIFRRNPAES